MKTKFYLCRLVLLTAIPLLFLFVNASAQTCLTQSAIGVANGGTIPNGAVYTTGTSTVKVNSRLESPTGGVTTATFTYNSGQQGNRTGFAALDLDNTTYDNTDKYYVTYTFARPVTGLNFSVLDVDQSGFQDDVEIFYNGGINIKSTSFYTLGGAAVAVDNKAYMDGFEGQSNANANQSIGNINLNFSTTPVTSVTIVYFSGTDPGPGNPAAQQIGISDMCWTGYAVANPLCFQWENQGYTNLQSLIATPIVLPTASDGNILTLSNSFVTNGGTIARILSFRSDVQGAHTGYLNVEMDNDAFDPNDQMTVNLNFAKPVTGLKFALLDVDLSPGTNGWQDDVEMYVNGVNVKSLSGLYTLGGTTIDVAVDNETYMDGFEGIAGNTASTNDFANITFDLGSIKVTSLSLKYFSGTNAVGNPANQRMGVSDLCWNSDKDLDGVPDYIDIDDDNDGITDLLESGGFDPVADADGDGIPNYLDTTPGTGLPAFVDTNTDGVNDVYDNDRDGIINAFDLDSDNDGIADIVENEGVDIDGDGRIDDVFADSDGDGLADKYDASTGGVTLTQKDTDGDGVPNSRDLDSDGDGIPDVIEAGGLDANNDGILDTFATDTDKDGLADSVDGDANNDGTIENTAGALIITGPDANNDGLADSYPRANIDGNGLPNPYDLDSDGDGILDAREAGMPDANNDGIADGILGTDGWSDTVDALAGPLVFPNTDKNGRPNYLDIDSDNDGIKDNVEAQGNGTLVVATGIDTDGDGIDNAYDNVPGTYGGTANNGLTPINTDGVGGADYADLDSDNDGIPDLVEAGGIDTNGDGFVDSATDTDGDGLADIYDTDNGGVNISNLDSDGDGLRNYRDKDSDNDGLVDVLEAGGADVNNDGFIDSFATDTDGDGLADSVDGDVGNDGTAENTAGALIITSTVGGTPGRPATYPRGNADNDGLPNPYDLDSDNDGIPDIVEARGVDTDGNGRIDGVFADTDGDGLANTYDPSTGGVALTVKDTDGDGIPNSRDLDSDGDGIPDVIEAGGTDANNDGFIDSFATDSDGDGLADLVDGDANNDGTVENTAGALIITGTDGNADGLADTYPRANLDNTGLPNPYDLDSDGDGILDAREAGMPDADNNGIADGILGADGWSDTVDAIAGPLTFPNTDGVGRPNYLDIDSDDDGLVDNNEAQSTAGYIPPAGADTDGDGIDNAYDNLPAAYGGNANNGISTLSNVDGDILPDYIDLDSDNDGYPDRIEGHDTDGDNRPDVGSNALNGITGGSADIDGDGLLDGYDNNTASTDATNSGLTPNSYPNVDGGTSERDWREAADSDADGVPNTTDGDADNDGIPNAAESGGFDPLGDADGDGIRNYLDTTPGAGLPAFVDVNGDGINDYYDADRDGIINALDLDSDNDGISDIIEAGGADADGNGRQDGAFVDTDSDGIANKYDINNGGTPLTNLDTDGDGIPNAEDTDSDGDGIPDVIEAGGIDANNDGTLDTAIVDSDGDGMANSVDGDANNDGTAENIAGVLIITGPDVNNDGRADTYPRANLDGTGLPNPYDLDSDGDGILDVREAGLTDTNNDGIADGTLGTDGWSDTVDALATLTLPNTDGTGRPNYLDIDSDDDGITDNVEGQSTAGYLLAVGIDSDNDGIDDSYDNNNGAYAGNANNGLTPYNYDGTDLPDYLDQDSDNDGQTDRAEGHDTNLNGKADEDVTLTGVDTDGDGLDDRFDLDNTGANVKNQNMSNGGSTTSPPTPGAAGPLQKSNAGNLDRDFRNALVALPVRLISFTGSLQDKLANLTWTADQEINFKEYVVERSFDNTRFSAVGTVAPKPFGVNTYTFPDNLSFTPSSTLYYRLKMVDIDGNYQYSYIIRLSLNSVYKLGVQVLPNPVRSSLFVKVISNRASKGVINITSVDGKKLISQQVNVITGDNVILIKEQGNLLNGYYIMTLTMDGKTFQEKVIISR